MHTPMFSLFCFAFNISIVFMFVLPCVSRIQGQTLSHVKYAAI